ncbi:MAG TPA: S1 RNA-binding domain-containing protein, partial [Gammaproteobacteria bacterium]
MNETILVNVGPRETRVVTLERGAVRDIYIERDAGRGIVGNIYLGKVVRVMPGMQAAFVDFGAERTGLLHISDLSGPKPRRGAR